MEAAIQAAQLAKQSREIAPGPLAKVDEKILELRDRVVAEVPVREGRLKQGDDRRALQMQDLSIPHISKVSEDGAIQVYVRTRDGTDSESSQLQAAEMPVPPHEAARERAVSRGEGAVCSWEIDDDHSERAEFVSDTPGQRERCTFAQRAARASIHWF